MEAIALDIAVTASALFLALLFVGMLIDILTNAAMKLGVPHRTHTASSYPNLITLSFYKKILNFQYHSNIVCSL